MLYEGVKKYNGKKGELYSAKIISMGKADFREMNCGYREYFCKESILKEGK